MVDYANVHIMGRATADAVLTNIEDDERISRAVFTVACNIPTKPNESKSVYRRIVAWGRFANYIADCQKTDGLKGRLIIIVGTMDDECQIVDGKKTYNEVVRVGSPAGNLTVIDRRTR